MHLISFAGAAYSPLQTAPEILGLATEAGVRRVTVLSGFEEGPVERAVGQRPGVEPHPAWSRDIREHGVVRVPFAQA